jgi:hypothetical protein
VDDEAPFRIRFGEGGDVDNGQSEEPVIGGTSAKKKHTKSQLWSKRQLRWDDIIIVFFALLGFIGSAVLYCNTSAPTTMVAFFLATGVASLVYRFLGGLERAEFVWGTLKVGGTMAALIGIAVYANTGIRNQQLASQQLTYYMGSLEGKYDWQFTDISGKGGWKGYVEVKSDGAASIYMDNYKMCGGVMKALQLFEKPGQGTVKETDNQTKMHLEIPVQFINYDANCNATGVDETTILVADLLRKPAFQGQVAYKKHDKQPLGEMILVKEEPSGSP